MTSSLPVISFSAIIESEINTDQLKNKWYREIYKINSYLLKKIILSTMNYDEAKINFVIVS